MSDNSTSIIARYKAENILAYQEGKAAKVAAPATISQTSLPSQNRVRVSTGQKVAVALVRSLFGYTLQRLGRQAAELRQRVFLASCYRNPVEAARPALEAVWGRLAPHISGAYANFLATATEEDVAAIYPAGTYKRLAAVKPQYDPGNLFARNHNVRPQ